MTIFWGKYEQNFCLADEGSISAGNGTVRASEASESHRITERHLNGCDGFTAEKWLTWCRVALLLQFCCPARVSLLKSSPLEFRSAWTVSVPNSCWRKEERAWNFDELVLFFLSCTVSLVFCTLLWRLKGFLSCHIQSWRHAEICRLYERPSCHKQANMWEKYVLHVLYSQ